MPLQNQEPSANRLVARISVRSTPGVPLTRLRRESVHQATNSRLTPIEWKNIFGGRQLFALLCCYCGIYKRECADGLNTGAIPNRPAFTGGQMAAFYFTKLAVPSEENSFHLEIFCHVSGLNCVPRPQLATTCH